MIRSSSHRPAEGTRSDPVQPWRGSALGDTRDCESYEPGHRLHYLQQARALRSSSLKARQVEVQGGVIVIEVGEERQRLEWRHHDPVRLAAVLALFPTARVVYPEFDALRLGPYWFACTPGELSACSAVRTAPTSPT